MKDLLILHRLDSKCWGISSVKVTTVGEVSWGRETAPGLNAWGWVTRNRKGSKGSMRQAERQWNPPTNSEGDVQRQGNKNAHSHDNLQINVYGNVTCYGQKWKQPKGPSVLNGSLDDRVLLDNIRKRSSDTLQHAWALKTRYGKGASREGLHPYGSVTRNVQNRQVHGDKRQMAAA